MPCWWTFAVVVPRVLAVVGIAERLVLEADLAFRRDGERLDLCACFLEARDRILGNGMLAVLRRHINDLLAAVQRFFQNRIENADGLSQPCRRLDQQRLPLLHSLFHGLHQLDLAGAGILKGKDEMAGNLSPPCRPLLRLPASITSSSSRDSSHCS